jgi:hypothetical protein
MAKQLKCGSCGATYPDTSQSGSATYFHVCPDKIVGTPEVLDAAHNIVTPAVFIPTPNPRNENLVPDPQNPGGYVMISAGSGVTAV